MREPPSTESCQSPPHPPSTSPPLPLCRVSFRIYNRRTATYPRHHGWRAPPAIPPPHALPFVLVFGEEVGIVLVRATVYVCAQEDCCREGQAETSPASHADAAATRKRRGIGERGMCVGGGGGDIKKKELLSIAALKTTLGCSPRRRSDGRRACSSWRHRCHRWIPGTLAVCVMSRPRLKERR